MLLYMTADSGGANLPFSFSPPPSVSYYSYRKEFPLRPLWKGYVVQGSKQEVTKVISLDKIGSENITKFPAFSLFFSSP